MKRILILFIIILIVIPCVVSAATTIKLQAPDTENLEDTYGYNGDGSPNHNQVYLNVGYWHYYGTWYTSYIKFNLSKVPSGFAIADAVLAVHGYGTGGGGPAGDVYVWRVEDQKWLEEECFNPGNCPPLNSYISTGIINGGGACGDYWYHLDGTPWVASEYLNGKSNVSFAFNVTYSVSGYTQLNSKENSDVLCRPYLNITYTRRPRWSTNQSSTPTTYSPTTLSEFNITWQDDESISNAFIEIKNSTGHVIVNNESMNNSYGGDVFDYSIVLPAGTFTWKSYANDTYNIWNSSDSWNITIAKTDLSLELSNDLNWSGTYPSESETSGSGCLQDLECNLYRNDTKVNNPDEVILGAGIYEYAYNTSGNENYNPSSISNILTIKKGILDLSINFNSSNIVTYPTETTTTGIETNIGDDDVIYELWRDLILIDNSSPYQDITTLSVGTYSYMFNASDGENWTANNITEILTVQQQPTTTPITVGVPIGGYFSLGYVPPTETTQEENKTTEEEIPEEIQEEVPEEIIEESPEEEIIQPQETIITQPTAPTGLFLGLNAHNWLISIAITSTIILVIVLLVLKRRQSKKENEVKDIFKYIF